MTVHSFRASLERSNGYVDAPWWHEVYSRAFPGMMAMSNVRQDGWAQRGGVDRIVTLRSGKTFWIDEKVRERAWPDFLLERWSDEARQTPGWVQKDLACDYIAYAFAPSRRCYLLPFAQLRKAWIANGRAWAARYPEIRAENASYTTVSVAVPIDVVLAAIQSAMTVDWSASNEVEAA